MSAQQQNAKAQADQAAKNQANAKVNPQQQSTKTQANAKAQADAKKQAEANAKKHAPPQATDKDSTPGTKEEPPK